ncbi:hypothetical protein F0562_031095 [Nyssa sinensis]|uniref:peptidyl-tRNA hydrolase n=1 Tax=Nyssa sinensis TaxID=561372 RepID=A0A5J5AX01_9ASTE|nr:hypothetical protein F0562_031095 [Nyssa sinensis]
MQTLQGVGLVLDKMDMTWLSAILVGAGCLALGYLIGVRHPTRLFVSGRVAKDSAIVDRKKTDRLKPPLEIEKLADILEDFKMVVRNDLKMGKGKIAAQCSHATLGLYKKLLHRAPKSLKRWEMCGQVKVVVKIENEDDLLVLQERAKSLNLPTHITIDAGRTQIAPNSRTVMAILGPAEMVDDVTGSSAQHATFCDAILRWDPCGSNFIIGITIVVVTLHGNGFLKLNPLLVPSAHDTQGRPPAGFQPG